MLSAAPSPSLRGLFFVQNGPAQERQPAVGERARHLRRPDAGE